MQTKTAIVIGSGVAGLAAATRLAVQGFEVSVYEANAYPGGKLSAFTKDGFHFDAGPSLFTQPQNIKELFDLAGEDMNEFFSYQKTDIACNYFYPTGKKVKAFSDTDLFAEEMNTQLGESPVKIKKYLSGSGKLYEKIGSVFLNHSLHKRRTWFHPRILKALGAVKFPYLFKTLNGYNRSSFSSPEAVQLFNRFATYNGSDPYQAPAMLSLIPHLEQNEGTFYPRGGMISITNALYRLAEKKAVKFHFNCPVSRIMYMDGKIKGVVVNDKNIHADVVVSNVDVFFTYKNLIGHIPKAKKVLKQERSSSALIFYWGIKGSFPELGLHNILFSADYKNEFQAIFKKRTLTTDPTVYINITSKIEPALAPSGSENWFVMINVPANSGQDWAGIRQKARQEIIAKINNRFEVDLESMIQTETILDPVLIEQQTSSFMGSLYGTSSNSKMAAFFRHPNFTNYIKGLYFCGGSVHPGGGIPLCLKSAKITGELISRDFKHKKRTSH